MKNSAEYIDQIILIAHRARVSDIHIDPGKEETSILFRIDGILMRHEQIPSSRHTEIIARLKILAGLRTDIHLIPHDGRFSCGEIGDIRVSIMPTLYGENAVLRILPRDCSSRELAGLGFTSDQEQCIRHSLGRPHGMILVTGPTGSGKTSTQYSLISEIDRNQRMIITLEDPIEYALPGVRQIQVNGERRGNQQKYGFDFAQGLRSVLRQDPDVIMVGEIRDTETAQIAMNASLTGHLLVSTLHTNSAIDVFPRLVDMKLEPYLIASTLSLVVSQRLVRRICSRCGDFIVSGCVDCAGTGYRGRVSIAEVVPVDDRLRAYIMKGLHRDDMQKYIRSIGIPSLYDDGMRKVEAGITTREEVYRVVHDTSETTHD